MPFIPDVFHYKQTGQPRSTEKTGRIIINGSFLWGEEKEKKLVFIFKICYLKAMESDGD